MTPEEILKKIEEIKLKEYILCNAGNDLWVQKNELRNMYKKITGNDI